MSTPWEFVKPLDPINRPIRRCSCTRKEASHRILILRLASYGDILMGTPLVTALRDAWPDAHITWAVERDFQDAIIAHPDIDEVLLWQGKFWKKMLRRGLYPFWLIHALTFARQIRHRYDIFISFQPEEWPLLTRGMGARQSIGIFDTFRRFNRERPTSSRTCLFTDPYVFEKLPNHRTDQYLLALEALGLPQPANKQMVIGYTAEDRHKAHEAFPADLPKIVFAPLTTWPSRCWPEDRWAALGNGLASEGKYQMVLIGSLKEKEGLERIATEIHPAPMVAAGALSFREIVALLDQAALLVTGDTGPMHVAAAVGTSGVALFGPTSVQNLAPLAGNVLPLARSVPCGPCDQKNCPNEVENFMLCMKLLTVEDALKAAHQQLGRSKIFL